MPPRNTRQQLARLQELCQKHNLMEISGVDINSSRQEFNCPEINLPEFAGLIDSTWALVAHERFATLERDFGFFAPNNPLADLSLSQRMAVYSQLGQKLQASPSLTKEEVQGLLKSLPSA